MDTLSGLHFFNYFDALVHHFHNRIAIRTANLLGGKTTGTGTLTEILTTTTTTLCRRRDGERGRTTTGASTPLGSSLMNRACLWSAPVWQWFPQRGMELLFKYSKRTYGYLASILIGSTAYCIQRYYLLVVVVGQL